MTNHEYVLFNGIFAHPDRISMFEGGTEVAIVCKADIRKILLEFGNQADRPVVQLVFGIIVLLAALFPIFRFVVAMLGYGRMHVLEFVILAFVPLGIWIIRNGLKYGAYLNIELENGYRKLGFQDDCEDAELLAFCRRIADLGYIVDTSSV
jgi:hypothetical protein